MARNQHMSLAAYLNLHGLWVLLPYGRPKILQTNYTGVSTMSYIDNFS